MEAVLLRCPPWGSELRREVPPDREFVAAHCLCKSAGEVAGDTLPRTDGRSRPRPDGRAVSVG